MSQMVDSEIQLKQLRATLSKMEIALSAVEECIVWTDRWGKIKWCNGALEKFLGQTRLFILGTSLLKKLPLQLNGHPVTQDTHPVQLALEQRVDGKQDYEFQKADQILILEIAWSFVEIGGGFVETDDSTSCVLVLRDVTKQREAERRLQESNELLERQVAQRTQELSEANNRLNLEAEHLQHLIKELQQTQVQLVQAEKMSSLGQLVAGIAHEINNPVNFIHGNLTYVQSYTENLLKFLQLYQQHNPKPIPELKAGIEALDLEFLQTDFPKLLASMQAGTERIRQIVLSLRNFSRMDEAELKIVDVHEGIDSTLLLLQHRLKMTTTRPEINVIQLYGTLPSIECYPGQLNQVFMDILVNAVEAIDELNSLQTQKEIECTPGCITIRTSTIKAEWIEIAIADNGIGMSEEVQLKAFDPFFTTKATGGTGIGLSISYQTVVKKHKGKFYCASTIGEGTEFVIQIPVRQQNNNAGIA